MVRSEKFRTVLGVGFVAAWVGSELGAALLLRRLGRVDGFAVPSRDIALWARDASTEDLVATAARLMGLALAYWLLAATLLSVARRVVPSWRHLHALDLVTPAALRSLVDRALLIGLGASLAVGGVRPAGATTRSTSTPVTVVTTAATPRSRIVDEPVVRTTGAVAPARATASAPVEPSAPRSVIVRAGDNLWSIAKAALQREGRAAGTDAIVPYWQKIIAANAVSIRSHDPNLIFPGERIALPPPPDGSATPG